MIDAIHQIDFAVEDLGVAQSRVEGRQAVVDRRVAFVVIVDARDQLRAAVPLMGVGR